MKTTLSIVLLIALVGCSEKEQSANARWYTAQQIVNGSALFNTHCALCHGKQAQGLVANWKQPLPDDSYPPPPLDGSGHAWHHPMKGLKLSIREGGVPMGGKMPAFKEKLNDDEMNSVIAYFQSKWNDKIYAAWNERNSSK